MATMAALLEGLPLALGNSVGSELRRPLGTAIARSLIFSQILTLYTAPVVSIFMDRLRIWIRSGSVLLIDRGDVSRCSVRTNLGTV